MYEIKLENLKGFFDVFTEQGEKYIEYYPYTEYEIIIDGRVLSHIYQDNRDIDKVEVFLANGSESLPMSWNDFVNVAINRITKKELPKHSIIKMIVSNAIGCRISDILESYRMIHDDTKYEFRIVKLNKPFNKNINNINALGYNIMFNDYDNRIEVLVKDKK